jgi:hypothetical protein
LKIRSSREDLVLAFGLESSKVFDGATLPSTSWFWTADISGKSCQE